MEKHTLIFNDVCGQAISQTVLFLTQTFSDGSFISSKTRKLSKVSRLYYENLIKLNDKKSTTKEPTSLAP